MVSREKRQLCLQVAASWSSGHVSAAGMLLLLMKEQGSAAETTRSYTEHAAKSGCRGSCVSLQRGFMGDLGFELVWLLYTAEKTESQQRVRAAPVCCFTQQQAVKHKQFALFSVSK